MWCDHVGIGGDYDSIDAAPAGMQPDAQRRSGRVLEGSRPWFGLLLLAVAGLGVPVAWPRRRRTTERR